MARWGGRGEPGFDAGSVIHEPSWEERQHAARRAKAPSRPPRRRVVLAVGAVLVAVAAAAGLRLARRPAEGGTAGAGSALGPATTTPGTDYSLFGRTYRPGDCVSWDQATTGDDTRPTRTAPCQQPHLLEVTGQALIPDPPDRFPSDDEWDVLITRACTPPAEAYLGTKIDPDGQFAVTALHPERRGWQAGERDLWCGLAARADRTDSAAGRDTPVTGSVRDLPQYPRFAPGTCLGDSPLSPVDCRAPHLQEVTAVVDLSGRTTVPDEHDDGGWAELLSSTCRQKALAYLGHAPPDDVHSGWMTISAASWAAGRRHTHCFVGRPLGDHWDTLTAPLAGLSA